MSPPCPTPRKLRWPLDDEWGPWEKMTEVNMAEYRAGTRRFVEVYPCRDHWHLRTVDKRAWERAAYAPEEERTIRERRRSKRQRRDLSKFYKGRRGRKQR